MNYQEIRKLYNNFIQNYNPYNIFMNEVPVNKGTGYLELYVYKNRQNEPMTDAIVTIYARQGEVNAVPIIKVPTTNSPTVIELPVAHPLGTLIKSPEYYFTAYNMTIDAEGFFGIVVNNIRIFPGIKVTFNYILNRLLPGVTWPQKSVVNIPPSHLD